MQDSERVTRGMADILSAKAEMEKILASGKAVFLAEARNSHALRYLLIQAVEAITDVCQHLLAKTKGVACDGYVDCIVKAGSQYIITPELAGKLRRLADLRNSLIHRYWIIRDEELFDQCVSNIHDLDDFCGQIR